MIREAETPRADAEAADWFARLSRPAVTTRALRQFRAWRQDPDNARAYARLEQAWSRAGELRHDPDIQALTQRTLARRPPPTDTPKPKVIWVGLGAAGLATAGLATLILLAIQPPTYRTKLGEQRLIVLADGSRVRLNTDTTLTVRFAKDARRLTLQKGEAFFEAAHDPARPFVVTADGAQVRAIGTRFDVRRAPEGVTVTLLEGQVSVRPADPTRPAATLRPNQTTTVTRQGARPPTATDATTATGWTTGRLTFRNLPLRQAAAEVNRYSPRQVELDVPPAIADAPVSGVFDVGDTQAFATAAGSLFDLTAQPTADGVRLIPRPSGPPAS